MNLDSFTGPGSTPSRRRFWDKVTQSVIASQKVEGKNVSVDEHQGYGSVLSINPERKRSGGPTGACCKDGDACFGIGGTYQGDDTTCEDSDCGEATSGACCHSDNSCTIETPDGCDGTYQGDDTVCADIDCNQGACCVDGICSVTTEGDCDGIYQGDGSTCEGVDCTKGACCVDGICSQTTEEDCMGTFQGIGVPCDPDPCTACDECAFLNPSDGRYYKTRTTTISADYLQGFLVGHYDAIKIETCTPDGITCEGSGDGTFSYQPDGSCDCTETLHCAEIPAFGFFGLIGLSYTETCDCPECDPECGSAFILSCDFGACTSVINFSYSIPCIPA